jgi:hypothetical protein
MTPTRLWIRKTFEPVFQISGFHHSMYGKYREVDFFNGLSIEIPMLIQEHFAIVLDVQEVFEILSKIPGAKHHAEIIDWKAEGVLPILHYLNTFRDQTYLPETSKQRQQRLQTAWNSFEEFQKLHKNDGLMKAVMPIPPTPLLSRYKTFLPNTEDWESCLRVGLASWKIVCDYFGPRLYELSSLKPKKKRKYSGPQ